MHGKRIAILVADGFKQVELTEPKKALQQAGARAEIVSPAKGKVKGWLQAEWGDEFPVDVPLDRADAAQYDGLVLPGGVMSPDKLRHDKKHCSSCAHFSKRANQWQRYATGRGY